MAQFSAGLAISAVHIMTCLLLTNYVMRGSLFSNGYDCKCFTSLTRELPGISEELTQLPAISRLG